MMEKLRGIYNLDTLADMMGCPSLDKLIDYNIEGAFEQGDYARKEAIKEGKSEEEADAIRDKAEEEAMDDVANRWREGVLAAANYLLGEHGLTLVPRRKSEKRPFEFRVAALAGWDNAARKIVETINGVGYFGFKGANELVDSGPYASPRQAVLYHIAWVTDYPAVYGGTSALRVFEQSWR